MQLINSDNSNMIKKQDIEISDFRELINANLAYKRNSNQKPYNLNYGKDLES